MFLTFRLWIRSLFFSRVRCALALAFVLSYERIRGSGDTPHDFIPACVSFKVSGLRIFAYRNAMLPFILEDLVDECFEPIIKAALLHMLWVSCHWQAFLELIRVFFWYRCNLICILGWLVHWGERNTLRLHLCWRVIFFHVIVRTSLQNLYFVSIDLIFLWGIVSKRSLNERDICVNFGLRRHFASFICFFLALF